jgi:hypothetical protein
MTFEADIAVVQPRGVNGMKRVTEVVPILVASWPGTAPSLLRALSVRPRIVGPDAGARRVGAVYDEYIRMSNPREVASLEETALSSFGPASARRT